LLFAVDTAEAVLESEVESETESNVPALVPLESAVEALNAAESAWLRAWESLEPPAALTLLLSAVDIRWDCEVSFESAVDLLTLSRVAADVPTLLAVETL
jgi:hypothetical protein